VDDQEFHQRPDQAGISDHIQSLQREAASVGGLLEAVS
jgi:hypothetical protein